MLSIALLRRNAAASLYFVLAFSIFSFSQTVKVLHTFNLTDGEFPYSGLARGSDGYLYGTTFAGGTVGCGTVFKISTSGNFKSIYSFAGGTDGCNPQASVIRDSAGNLYGTTESGGASNVGTVFKIDRSGRESVFYAFQGGSDGASPITDLVRDKSGNLYGTTASGGGSTVCAQGCGIAFKIDPSGKETILHAFTGGVDGGPSGGLVQDSAGNLYGPGFIGGLYGYGNIFEIDSAGNLSVLLSFGPGLNANGDYPWNDLAFGPGAILYGTTYEGGDLNACIGFGCGVVFSFSQGVETVIHSFGDPPSDVSLPAGPIARDAVGNLYGAAGSGGPYDAGAVYKVDSSGNETLFYSFRNGTDGGFPSGRLYVTGTGTVYGTATADRHGRGYGVVFKITP
ncbi:MAG: choice-of-anchor tandem repeat GloVer-containing protein [Candidatus Sulfotelmatobacter sp.]